MSYELVLLKNVNDPHTKEIGHYSELGGYQAARKVLKGYGLDRAFIHSTGHGLGLEIHEPPRIGKRDKLRLQAGMAITIEPGVYIEDFGGIRIEDTVVVTRTGCEILTPTPKTLCII